MKRVIAAVLVVLLPTACYQPPDTRSVHLPLAVGNQWVYNVNGGDAVAMSVSSEQNGEYELKVSGAIGHVILSDGPLRLRCRDSVLWANDNSRWSSVLSDDPAQFCTETMLLFRFGTGEFVARSLDDVIIGVDTFHNCLCLECECYGSWGGWAAGSESTLHACEIYAPEVGLVRFALGCSAADWVLWERHSHTWGDTWELRDYRLAGE